MNKLKFYKWMIGALVISNALLIVFLIIGKPHHPPHPREIIIERLHFDDDQIKQYDALINAHRKAINDYETELMKAKNTLYQELQKPEDGLTRDYLLQKMTRIQENIERTHFMHFLSIKKMCKEEQLADFNKLTEELGKLFQPPRPPKKDH